MLNDVQCGDLLKMLWYDGQGGSVEKVQQNAMKPMVMVCG
jgi:hypothetical protein